MSASATTRVICCQLAPVLGDLARNTQTVSAAITAAVAAGAAVIVLPELATSGYCFSSTEQARSVAIRPDDPVFTDWAAAAGDAVVVLGFAEAGDDGALHNSAAVLMNGGVHTVYRKTHLWDTESLHFSAGHEAAPVVQTAYGRIGVLVCYDLEFPEMARSVAMRGAELLVVPTNWPLLERPPHGEHAPEVVIAMAAARVNHVFIACCDRTGSDAGEEWTHGTSIVSANGWVVASAPDGAARMVMADLDLPSARRRNISPRNHLFDDRRPHLYADLLATPPSRDKEGTS